MIFFGWKKVLVLGDCCIAFLFFVSGEGPRNSHLFEGEY